MNAVLNTHQEYDFVIVGSGAGGGPLAANLALEGFSVLVIEAGGDKINDHYSVPAFHALSTEDPEFSWEFYVKHYADDNHPERDPKYHKKDEYPGAPGIFYPRASGVGGCTTHHAMITVYPAESDWNNIAAIISDDSCNAKHMRKYFDRLEHAQYRDGSVLLKLLRTPWDKIRFLIRSLTSSEEGDGARAPKGSGWLAVSQADPTLLLRDIHGVLKVVLAAFKTAVEQGLHPMPGLNPNDPLVAEENREGVNVIPISVNNGRRTGARERLFQAKSKLEQMAAQGITAGKLDIVTNTFATQVILVDEGGKKRATGVKCTPGESLYNARHHARTAGQKGTPVEYHAKREVILSGGAFNTPQLLMLSGIGPKEELQRHGIDVKIASPGVGKNLQDRYEVGVVARAPKPFKLLEEAKFKARNNPTDPDPDSSFTEWREDREGIYATNGSVLGIIKRSSTRKAHEAPDLYIFGVPGHFRGYRIGYSEEAVNSKDQFTWAVLKGHTDNTSGEVKLKSADPYDTPDINFHYFEESHQNWTNDVQSVVDGINFVLDINKKLMDDGVIVEQVAPDPKDDLHTFVRNNAWGHHASCSCKIGADDDELAVLDKDFRVRGTTNLRVVDASVFPRIPGLFILSSVYMISEKASDVIISQNKSN
jgi:choline dehydrogenase